MIIYKIQNKINGKIYIGQTVGTLEHRMSQHKANGKKISVIGNAIHKYDWDNFDVEVIDEAETIEELNRKEIYWIGYYKSLSPNGYNLELGGRNALHEEETRKKISQSLKGKYQGEKNSRAKKVYMFSLSGELVEEYGSVREAGRKNNICSSQIAGVCRGEHYIAGGFRWSYDKNNLADIPTKSAFLVKYQDKVMTLKDWSIFLGIPYGTIQGRIKNGWSIEKAFTEPIHVNKRNKKSGKR